MAADALVAAYTAAAEEMADAPLHAARARRLGPLRAVPGAQVAR